MAIQFDERNLLADMVGRGNGITRAEIERSTAKALKALKPGDLLEVHCTDPLSVIDIPNLIRETGDKVEITERAEDRIVFLIEKSNGLSRADTPS